MSRPPASAFEALTANCRPQPAIPALLVLLITMMGATSATGDGPAWTGWLIGAGLLASCGLAIAAGFCSLAPPAGWLVLAFLGSGVLSAAPGAAYLRVALLVCAAAAMGMIGLQLWRIRTGQFVPTIADRPDIEA